MPKTVDSLMRLEKVKRPPTQAYCVYTYILNADGTKPVGYFIPLYVTANPEEAEAKAKEIIETTGCSDVLTWPMGHWLSLGDESQEKVTTVEIRDGLREYGEQQDHLNAEYAKERRRLEKEIEAEQKAITDETSIESLYYDWVCAVQNKGYIDKLKEEIVTMEAAYRMRIDNIKMKYHQHPNYRDEWKPVLLERLDRRGEKSHAEALIKKSEEIALLEEL